MRGTDKGTYQRIADSLLTGQPKPRHDSRHTAATWIGRSGKFELLELCKAFGWKDPKHALIYFNPTGDDLARKLDGVQ